MDSRIIKINIEDEMKTAYIDYSMSVIVSRALPDVRDGLKPVQRRVLYGMDDLGLTAGKAHKKSARIVGEVLGKYHPHGDSSVYDAMVRMAQPWSLRYPLVDGQGNFGSMDGDSPAAMRYTEARQKRISAEILRDIEKDTVDFQLNFDDSLEEPTVLPSRIPNLLINGASGIAVGMATNMLPHNLTEIVNGIIAYIQNPEIEIKELIGLHIKAPDFPTGGIIYGVNGVKSAFLTGRGRVVVRARAEIETYDKGKRERIIVTEIPYQVNKANLIKRTADLVNEKRIEGISAIRDESDRRGLRIVYEVKRDANANVVLNQLFSYTQLQTSYGVNNVCLVKGRPRLLNIKDLIHYFVEFRHEVVIRRTQFELEKAEARAHILEGLLKALDIIDEIIALIRASQTGDEARTGLIERFEFSELQAKAILDMRLQRLTGLERNKLQEDYDNLMKRIAYLRSILGDEILRMQIITDELIEVRDKFGDERRTEIVVDDSEITIEELVEREKVAVTISHLGYIKRTSLTEYREQNRGGRGSMGGGSRDEDFIEHLFVGSTHDYLLVFTQRGKCYWLRTFHLPEGSRTSKGRAIQNLISLDKDDKVMAYLSVKSLDDAEYINNHFVVFCTRKGLVKKTVLEAYSRPRQNGIIAININDDDDLLEVKLTNGNCDILLGSRYGKCNRFDEALVRSMGRNSMGVRGIRLNDNGRDRVVGMICIDRERKDATVLSVSEKGYGKRTPLEEYRVTSRGGKGVATMNVTEKTGGLCAIKELIDDNGLMIINKSGITIRISAETVSIQGRNTQGVRLINLGKDDEIASVAKIPPIDVEDENEQEEEETAITAEAATSKVDTQVNGLDNTDTNVDDDNKDAENDNTENTRDK